MVNGFCVPHLCYYHTLGHQFLTIESLATNQKWWMVCIPLLNVQIDSCGHTML